MTTNNTWHVRVDLPAQDIDQDRAIELLNQLGDLRAGVIPTDDALVITVNVEAGSLRQAIAAALQHVEAATSTKAVGIEALTHDEIERRLTEPVIPDLVGYAEIAGMLGVSRARARQLAELEGFPPAVVTTATGPLRVRAAVEEWAKTRRTHAGRPRKSETAEA